LFLGKSTKTAATRAALFDFNMHQIVYLLGLRPRPYWGAYSAPQLYLGGILLKGEEGRGEEWERRRGNRRAEEKRGEGRGGEFVLCPRKKKRKVGA